MSSAGARGGAASQRYFCHQCNRTVTLTPSPSGELACPRCNGGFVEEFDPPTPNPNPSPFMAFHASFDPFASASASASPFPVIFPDAAGSFVIRDPADVAGLIGSDLRSPSHSGGPEPFNPLVFIQNYIQSIVAGGANIQLVFDGAGPPGGNLGDYFIGPGLEQLIQQLAENDPNRYGTPPAAKSVVQSLPDVEISDELLASDDDAQCAVCKDTFETGDQAKQMPCKHIYHKECILPWLELHNSCPVCRYELPTDDPEYEQRTGRPDGSEQRMAVAVDAGGSSASLPPPPAAVAAPGEGNSPGPAVVERRFRISLPWPFRFGSQAEGSNTGGGGGAAEPRQEDLD